MSKKAEDVIVKGKIAFPVLFEAKVPEINGQKLSQKAVFSCLLNFDEATAKEVKAKLLTAGFKQEHIDAVVKLRKPKEDKAKDEKSKDAKEVKEAKVYFIRAASEYQPNIYKLADKVSSAIEVPNGSEVRLRLAPREWEYLGKQGIKLYLNAVQILKLAESQSGFDDDFDLTVYEEEMPA